MNRLDQICTQELSLRELLRNHNRIAFCYHIFHNSDGQKTPMNFNLISSVYFIHVAYF